jgi:hypothetical protein
MPPAMLGQLRSGPQVPSHIRPEKMRISAKRECSYRQPGNDVFTEDCYLLPSNRTVWQKVLGTAAGLFCLNYHVDRPFRTERDRWMRRRSSWCSGMRMEASCVGISCEWSGPCAEMGLAERERLMGWATQKGNFV